MYKTLKMPLTITAMSIKAILHNTFLALFGIALETNIKLIFGGYTFD